MLHLDSNFFSGSVGNTRWEMLRCVSSAGEVDVKVIANATGIALSTVRSHVDQFIQLGILQRAGVSEAPGGRPGQLYSFSPDAGHVVGIEIGRKALEVSIADLAGRLLYSREHDVILRNPPDEAVATIAACVNSDIEQAGLEWDQIAGAGAAVQGLCLGPDDVWPYWPSPRTVDRMPLQSMLSDRLELPVFVEDHGRARLMVEKRCGSLKDERNAAFIWIDTGIAAYFLLNGKVFRQSNGMNGEFGHLIIEPDGPTCACGRRGCLEAVASVPSIEAAILRQVGQGSLSRLVSQFTGRPDGPTIEDILRAAEEGDQMAYVALHQAAERIGHALSILLNIMGPMVVVLGGVLASSQVVFEAIRRTAMLEVVPPLFARVAIGVSQAGEHAGSYGAALAEIESIFSSPRTSDQILGMWTRA